MAIAKPHGVKYWCVGNEMDGPWQIGHLEADDYGKKAREAAKMMRWHDPSIKLVLCGSSNFGDADLSGMGSHRAGTGWDQVDYHSLHYYANNHDNDTASYLALAAEFEAFVDTLTGVLRYVKAKNRSKHDVYLSWDEWNVWYKATCQRVMQGGWSEAPHLIEEVYNLEDALVVAQWMNVFLRKSRRAEGRLSRADRERDFADPDTTRDALLKQSIYYPFMLFSKLASGTALDVAVKRLITRPQKFGDMPLLDVSASYDESRQQRDLHRQPQPGRQPARDLALAGSRATADQGGSSGHRKRPEGLQQLENPDAVVPFAVTPPAVQDGRAS